jgi:hypothetical protein
MMSYEDFMKAMVPYNYREAKEEKEEEEKEKEKEKMYENLMKIADIDGDGNINIYEYFLIGRFLQMIETDMKSYFNNKESISQEEMINYIEHLN